MITKSFLVGFSFILFLINGIKSLHEDQYVLAIEKLLLNKQFLQEYQKWSSKLFSDPDYLYGEKPEAFPCQISSKQIPDEDLTVHNLRPNDIQCVAAIGDSITAGLGAQAKTPIGLFTEYRGVSWSVGGDQNYDQVLTLPNILRQYNPNLKGFSTGTDIIFLGGQNATNNHLNVAKSGDTSIHMLDQAKILLARFNTKKDCDLINDWKVITLFVGGNDLCLSCEDYNAYSPENYAKHIQDALDFFHANIPRAFVNLVLVLDVRSVETLNAGGLVCELLHSNTCPCAAYPRNQTDRDILAQYINEYQQKLIDLVNTGRYDTKNDFTVVVQPFMSRTPLPLDGNGQPDYSYFAPDCFHFSGKGQSRSALSLWNNMLEPVGQKLSEWHVGEQIECPTQDRPYFATRLNSPQSFEKIPKKEMK
jgi:phospholipase B1